MDTNSYKTLSINKEAANKEWVIVDATDQVLGRFASKIAMVLRGKHKACYTPHSDCGDNVIIINAEKIQLTGNKFTDKVYVRHSGYPGSQKFRNVNEMLDRDPSFILRHAIKGMLPKNALGRQLLRNVRIYAGQEHDQQGQQPKEIDLNKIK